MDDEGFLGERFVITTTDAARKSGFPIMKKYQDGVLVSWTKVGNVPSVETAIIKF